MEFIKGELYYHDRFGYYACVSVDGPVVQLRELRKNGYLERMVGFSTDLEQSFTEANLELLSVDIERADETVQNIEADMWQEKKYLELLKVHSERMRRDEQEKLRDEETVLKEVSESIWWHGHPDKMTANRLKVVDEEVSDGPVTRGGPWDGINASRRAEGASVSDKEAYKILTTPVTVGLDWKPVGKSDEETKVVINNFTGRGFDTTQRYDITVTLDSNATPQDIVDAISEKMIRAVSIDETSCDACLSCTNCDEELINEQVRIAEADGKPEPGHIIFDPSVLGATDG